VIIYQTRLSKFITGVPDANCESNYLLKEQDISRLRILSCLSETLNFLSRLIPHKEKTLERLETEIPQCNCRSCLRSVSFHLILNSAR
jgi:hypothetical protein